MRISEDVRSTHGPDGGVVLDIRRGRMFRLNPVASRILELLEGQSAEAEIIEEISREFGASQEVVAPDVREFLVALERHRLLEVHRPAGTA